MTIPGVDRMQSAAKKAFDRVSKATNVESDPELSMYGTLKANDFSELMKVYGEQPIVDYIKEMEGKRILGGKHKGGNRG